MHENEQKVAEVKVPAKRGRKPKPGSISKDTYFGDREEQAIKNYLFGDLSLHEKNELFQKVINPCFNKLVDGVMSMPKFQKILGITREQLREDAYFHLIFQMEKFKKDKKNAAGEIVKAYSYYGTIVKNYVLGVKIANDGKIAHHGGTIDIDTIGDHVPDNRRSPESFEEARVALTAQLEKAVEAKRLNKNDLIVGNTLKYMLVNWHKLEFQSKNEFIRLVCHYTQLSPPVVARSLKKYKLLAYDLEEEVKVPKKQKPEIKSTLASIITEAYGIADLNKAKEFVITYLRTTKIKEEDKEEMIFQIETQYTQKGFQQYITNCLLKFENLSLSKHGL